jgi:hypothetical protein
MYKNGQQNIVNIINNSNIVGDYGTCYVLSVSGSGSSYIQRENSCSNSNKYYSACYVNIENYTKGELGINIGSNKDVTINRKTTGFEMVSSIIDMDTSHGYFVGSTGSATLDGFICSPIIINMNIFENIPDKDKLDELYKEYVKRLHNMWVKMEEFGKDIPSSRICVMKIPQFNTRSCKSFNVTPYFEKNAYSQTHPASMSKTLSTLLILDTICDFNKVLTLKQFDIDITKTWYSKSEISLNDKILFKDLLYMIIMQSSNVCTYLGARVAGEQILRNKNL